MEMNCRMTSQMRRFIQKTLRVPGQDNGVGSKIQFIIGPGKALQKPAAEKTRVARDEYAFSSDLISTPFCVSQDVVQIVCESVFCLIHLVRKYLCGPRLSVQCCLSEINQ